MWPSRRWLKCIDMNKKQIRPLARLHGYWLYKTFLRQTDHWNQEKRRRYIFDRLKTTLIRAFEGTRFYRDKFNQVGFDPRRDFKSPRDLGKVAILTKEDVRSHYAELIDRRFYVSSVEANTSGTTGEPMRMRLNEHYIAFDYACLFRHWAQAGYTFRAPMAALRSYVPSSPADPLWKVNIWQKTLYMSAYHLSPSNCDQYLEQILRFRPRYLRGYPSSLNILAEFAAPKREELGFVQGLFTASETLLPGERDNIEHTFGKKLYDWYGMTEPVIVITETGDHGGMRVNWEYGYAEFLPSPELPPNEYRLIATGFHNPVMPFIRYDTGDIVRLPLQHDTDLYYDDSPPPIDSIAGRKDECIIMPDGRRLPSLNFYSVFRDFTDILKFQIIQFGRAELLVKIALRKDTPNTAALLKALRQQLLMRFGSEAALEIQVTEKFFTNADGKTPPVIRKSGTRAVEEAQAYASSTQAAWQMERAKIDLFKLDYNESDESPSPAVRERLRQLVENDRYYHWYPESETPTLQTAIASYCGAEQGNILVTHGSDMVIELMATAFLRYGDHVLVVNPTYEKFQYMVEGRGATVDCFDYFGDGPFRLGQLVQTIRQLCPRMVYVSNPNNPIGYTLPVPDIARIAAACDELGCLLLHDEAYHEFSGITAVPLVERYRCLVVSRTFSKAFGLAGLRLGYLVAHEETVRLVGRVNNTNHVTMLAKEAGLAALRDLDYMKGFVREVDESKQDLYLLLQQHQVHYYPSAGNYVLIRWPKSSELCEHLKRRQIFVRDKTRTCNNVGHLRVSVGGKKSSAVLLRALADYFSAQGPRVPESTEQALSGRATS